MPDFWGLFPWQNNKEFHDGYFFLKNATFMLHEKMWLEIQGYLNDNLEKRMGKPCTLCKTKKRDFHTKIGLWNKPQYW